MGSADAVPRQPDPDARTIRCTSGGSRSQGNEEARQQFLDGYVPQIWELGLTVPDPKLRKRDDGVWEYTEPDWDELVHVVTGHGPKTAERLEPAAGDSRGERAWVRARGARGSGVIYEVFRQERKGQAFAHAGSVEAPNEEFAEAYAREQYGRRGESAALWVVPREAVHEIDDFADELQKNYHRASTAIRSRRSCRKARERADELLELADDELILGWRNSSGPGSRRCSRRTSPSRRSRRTRSGTRAPGTSSRRASSARPRTSLPSTAGPRSTGARALVEAAARAGLGRDDRAALPLRDGRRKRIAALKQSDDPEIAGLAAKIDREEAYHRMHAQMWFERLQGRAALPGGTGRVAAVARQSATSTRRSWRSCGRR